MANKGRAAGTKDGYRGGAQGSPVSKVFAGSGKTHTGGSVARAIAGGAGILNGSGQGSLKSPATPGSNMSRSAWKGGSTTPSAARRRSGG